MKGRRRGKGKVVRHRSPMPPPSRIIDKTSYRRSSEKEKLRRQMKDEA